MSLVLGLGLQPDAGSRPAFSLQIEFNGHARWLCLMAKVSHEVLIDFSPQETGFLGTHLPCNRRPPMHWRVPRWCCL